MKTSKYNFFLRDSGFVYWYNSLSNVYFRISDSLSYKIEKYLIRPDSLKELSLDFFNLLVSNGFIINDEIDEINIIREKNNKAIHSKDYYLILLPTLDCNFECWYCIQNHIPSKMDTITLENIKNHLDYMIDNKRIESLNIEWFGGEPFMYFKDIIEPISLYAIKKCSQANIPFRNSSTTNAYYINHSIASKLKGLKFQHFQITLDGSKEMHDKIKYQAGLDSAFSQVLNNVKDILIENQDISISLRINYTHESLDKKIIADINSIIDPALRNRIKITPRKVWQIKADKSFSPVWVEILDEFEKSGYTVQRWNPSTTFYSCYTNKEYYNAINYNGNVVKCTACDDLYSKDSLGLLLPNGRIKWKDNYDLKYLSKSFEDNRCLSCKKLPACMGQCPRNFLYGAKKCKYDSSDRSFEDELLDFMKKSYK